MNANAPPRDSLATLLLSSSFVVIWASGFIVARLAAPHGDPFTFLSFRYGLSILVFVIASAAIGASWPRDWASWRDALIAGILLNGLYIGGVFWAIWHGLPAGVTALVTGLHPLITAALAIPLLREHVNARQWMGIAVGFVGVGLVVAPALAAAKGLSPAPFLVSLGVWGALLWAVFVISVGAISLLLVLLKRGAASRVAPLLYVAPPVAALIAYFMFDEKLAAIQVAGMALAIAGAYMARHTRL